MGKSACFKAIVCGSNSSDPDDLEPLQNKGSSDKRNWSFRKRSARYRMLNNTVISENPCHANKETYEPANGNVQIPINSNVPEKISLLRLAEEKPQLSALKESNIVAASTIMCQTDSNQEDENNKLDVLEESFVIVIQSTIRRFLAQTEFLKLKNVVKLQAAVRGHLVRRQAVGSLRCVQAIVKMQTLVRARQSRMSLERDTEYSGSKLNVNSTSFEKILKNGFAGQLLISTPKTKLIDIKCDRSRPNSTWKWLERWMSVSSSQMAEPMKVKSNFEKQEQVFVEPHNVEAGVNETKNTNTYSKETEVPSQSMEFPINNGSEIFDIQPKPEKVDTSNLIECSVEKDLVPNISSSQLDKSCQVELQPEIGSQQAQHSVKENGSTKFVTTQSKFQKYDSSANSDFFCPETVQCAMNSIIISSEHGVVESSALHSLRVQTGGSECGTEISITSTLDSPNISKSDAVDYGNESKILNETILDDISKNGLNQEPNLFSPSVQTGTSDSINVENVNKKSTKEEAIHISISNLTLELELGAGHQIYALSSPEASLKSHATASESQGTSSSQVSCINAKRKKINKTRSNHKARSILMSKTTSPLNPSHDSGARYSSEHKTGMRRTSFGSVKAESIEQDSGDGNMNSLPSYMKPTEATKAKANAANSPRSSPDVQDKEFYLKKRHSLSGPSSGRNLVSPHIPAAKGNDANSPKDRKWQR